MVVMKDGTVLTFWERDVITIRISSIQNSTAHVCSSTHQLTVVCPFKQFAPTFCEQYGVSIVDARVVDTIAEMGTLWILETSSQYSYYRKARIFRTLTFHDLLLRLMQKAFLDARGEVETHRRRPMLADGIGFSHIEDALVGKAKHYDSVVMVRAVVENALSDRSARRSGRSICGVENGDIRSRPVSEKHFHVFVTLALDFFQKVHNESDFRSKQKTDFLHFTERRAGACNDSKNRTIQDQLNDVINMPYRPVYRSDYQEALSDDAITKFRQNVSGIVGLGQNVPAIGQVGNCINEVLADGPVVNSKAGTIGAMSSGEEGQDGVGEDETGNDNSFANNTSDSDYI